MKHCLSLLLVTILLSACASVHPGKEALQIGGDMIPGLKVSAEELSDPSEEAFSMIAVTFENQSSEWIKVEKVDVLIEEKYADKISVVVGNDLQSWASAMEARESLRRQNTQTGSLGLTLSGLTLAAVGAGAKNRGLLGAGVLAAVVGQGWRLSDSLHAWYAGAEDPKAVPSDYVTQPFAVPGKMFLRRWLLLNKPVGQQVTVLPIAVLLVDGRREVLNVRLK